MATVGIRELKARTSEIMRRVSEAGETIEITQHGRVIARLVPAHAPNVDPEQLTAELDELDRIAADIGADWPEGISAVDAIAEDRQ
jgi:prevent-host-death family protein